MKGKISTLATVMHHLILSVLSTTVLIQRLAYACQQRVLIQRLAYACQQRMKAAIGVHENLLAWHHWDVWCAGTVVWPDCSAHAFLNGQVPS